MELSFVARVRQLALLALVSGMVALGPNAAAAQSLNGMCLDMREAGCMPRFLPFEGRFIGFCEETCELTNPVNVRGMDAVLYDLSCMADYDSPLEGARVMLLAQTGWDGRRTMSWIYERDTYDIVPCP